jgi:hypothetical protein
MITISSQKENSVGRYNMVYVAGSHIFGVMAGSELRRVLGDYDSEERAMDVLEEIRGIVHSRSDKFYQMPIR